jgi:hypothetical protein
MLSLVTAPKTSTQEDAMTTVSETRLAEIDEMARHDYPAFRALPDAQRAEWMAIRSPRVVYPATVASRRAVRERRVRREQLARLADDRDDAVRALSTDAELAR